MSSPRARTRFVRGISRCFSRGVTRTSSITENYFGPNYFHLRTYVNDRYKLTVYATIEQGELFDLKEDPGEINNLWDDPGSQALKGKLMHEFMQETIRTEGTRMPRIAGA